MYILDTDHLSLIQRNGIEGKRIIARLLAAKVTDMTVTVITYEEQVRGRLSVLSRAMGDKLRLLVSSQGDRNRVSEKRLCFGLMHDSSIFP